MADRPSISDAVVIGGGLHGLSTAIHLAEAGLQVTLLESDLIGRHASGANAGGVRRLGRALPEIPLAVAALERWHRIDELVGDDCAFVASHQIKVAETEAELEALEERSQIVRDFGFEHEEMIGRNALRAHLPDVAVNCVGGMIVHGDGHANPLRTVQAFYRRAVQLSVRVEQGSPVRNISRSGGNWQVETPGIQLSAPVVVNAAGAWGERIAAMMGDTVQLEAHALMLMITERLRPFLSPVVGAQGRALSFKQFADGTVLIGGAYQGSADLSDGSTSVDIRGLAANVAAAAAIFPLMRNVRIARAWAGIEGVTPDRVPIIGPGANDGAFHLFGFSAHGFALSPITGQIIADLVTLERTSFDISSFAVGRS